MSFEGRGTLFIFFDESGNFDFSPNGTRFWALGALCTYCPTEGREKFIDFAYHLAEEGQGQECFHATEDKQAVRDRVFAAIKQVSKNFDIHFTIAEKSKVPPALRKDDVTFFSFMCMKALRYLVQQEQYRGAKKLVVIFSSIFNRPKHERLRGEIKSELKKLLQIPVWIYFKSNNQDLNCQIADYCCWAIFIKWTRNQRLSYELIADKISSEESLFPADGPDYYNHP